MFKQLIWGALVLLFLGGMWSLAPLPVAAQEVRVEPGSGTSKTEFTFYADGFQPSEPVNYWLSAPGGAVLGNPAYEVEADGQGRAEWTWQAPGGSESGVWLMVGRGRESGIERVIRFEIVYDGTQEDTPQQIAWVEPEIGSAGTTFSFLARHFDGSERIGYWVNTPDGRVISDRNYKVDAEDGVAEWTWTAPPDAPAGLWQMVARGNDSTIERVIFFRVQ